jgi:hypothetical protein
MPKQNQKKKKVQKEPKSNKIRPKQNQNKREKAKMNPNQ